MKLGPMTAQQARAAAIVAGMEPWWRDLEKLGKKPNRDGRTRNEECFDSGVMAAAELIRRMLKNNDLSLSVHEITSFMRKERANP